MNESNDESPSRTLYVTLKARSVPMMNHVFAAILLLSSAATSIMAGHHVAWALAETAVALTLIVSVARDLHLKRTIEPTEQFHEHIGWVEIISGLFVGVEAYSRTLGPHHVSFVVLAFIPAVMLVALGVLEPWLARRVYIRTDAEQLSVHVGRRAKFTVPWKDVADLDRSSSALFVRLADGTTRKLPAGALWQSAYIQDWVLQRAREHGVRA